MTTNNDKKDNQKIRHFLCILLLLGILLIIIASSFSYFFEIRPSSEKEISNFIGTLNKTENPEEKVILIANYTVKDYFQTYGKEPSISLLFFGGLIYGDYLVPNESLHVKPGIFFINDPYFIAYYKTGACGEIATYFNFVANRAGIQSRIVGTPAEDHAWNEVKINDSWIQVDPTIYYYYYHDPKNFTSYQDLWFNNTNAYSAIGWYSDGYSKVIVRDTNEDLTSKYCNAINLTIICEDCDHIRMKSDNGKQNSIDQEYTHSSTLVTIGRKNYSIIGEKTIIPFLLVKEDNVSVSLMATNVSTVSLSPNKMKIPVFSQQLLQVVALFSALIFALIFDYLMVIRWYKNKRERH